MSKKTELIGEIQKFKSAYEVLEKNIRDKRESGSYTDLGLQQETTRLLNSVEESIQNTHDRLANLVDRGLEALENSWKAATTGHLMESGYQGGLSAAIKMLELEAVTDKRDVMNLIETYEGDYNAMAVLKKVLLNSQNEQLRSYAMEIPKDYRGDTRRLLGSLRRNIDEHINIYAVAEAVKGQDQGFTSLSLALEGMIVFVRDRLGDDLQVQEWQQES